MLTLTQRWTGCGAAISGLVILWSWPFAVQAQQSKPAFEVASVKRNAAGPRAGGGSGFRPGGLFNATNVPLAGLIRLAYNVLDFQIIGGPEWVREDRFDITARSSEDTTRDEGLLMLQTLLKDRFRLGLRLEKREMPAYALVRARTDGRLGPLLQSVPSDCDTPAGRAAAAKRRAASRPSVPRGSPSVTATGQCILMSSLARNLSTLVETPVIDKTGLVGRWDYILAYDPSLPSTDRQLADVPSLFAAVSEQLGLQLQRERESVDVLVIETVQPPAEN
jgi:uncharacterized protein (TIGR03435 family)